jgi:hypothetical protein
MINEIFYLTKGTIALIAACMFMYHMTTAWRYIERRDQQLRYYALLAYTITISYASAELAAEHQPIHGRHILTLLVNIFVIYVAWISIRETRKYKSST